MNVPSEGRLARGATEGSLLVIPARARRLVASALSAERLVTILAVLLLMAMVLAPIAFLLFGSFRTGGPGAPNAGYTLANWQRIVQMEGWRYFWNSGQLGAWAAVLSVVLGMIMAWFVAKTNCPGRVVFSNLLIVPLLFSPLLTTLAWIGLAGPNAGLINTLGRQFLGTKGPLVDIYSLGGIILLSFLHFTPYVFVATRAALVNLDQDLDDAARVLGATRWTVLRTITVPLIMPALVGSGLLVFALGAEEFTVPTILGGTFGFLTVPYAIYEAMGTFPSKPMVASAYGVLFLVWTISLVYLYLRTTARANRYVTISGRGGRAGIILLPRPLKWLGFSILVLYMALAVGLPYLMLLLGSFSTYFATADFSTNLLTMRNYQAILNSPQLLLGLRNTVILLFVAATATTLFATFVSWVSVRGRWRFRHSLHYLATAPIMIPGVALGLGMFWAYVFIPTGLYGTLGILVVAYLTRYVGHGTRLLTTGLLQMSSELEEAATTLGSSRLRALWDITIPVLRVPLGSAWVLVGIFVSLEVSASIMLYTGQSMPVSVFLWLTMHGGVIGEAFAAGAIITTVTFTFVVVAQRFFRVLDRV